MLKTLERTSERTSPRNANQVIPGGAYSEVSKNTAFEIEAATTEVAQSALSSTPKNGIGEGPKSANLPPARAEAAHTEPLKITEYRR